MSARTLEGSVALVTGAGRGIGRSIAILLAERGARVMATARTLSALERLAAEADVDYVAGSVTSPEDRTGIVAQTRERLGPIDILVNNAGAIAPMAPLWKIEPDVWRETLALNLDAPFELTRLVAGEMVERGRGRIVMIGSTASQVGFGEGAAYCTAKHGLLGLMRSVAQDVGARGVTCNAVCPGAVHTSLTDRWLAMEEARGRSSEEAYAEVVDSYLPKRLLRPGEIAATVAFLASPEASGINGEAITVALGSRQ
jgi:NAD(P)-dependent dehydrogenase (short-subunit alcohol dehydrogenase family)